MTKEVRSWKSDILSTILDIEVAMSKLDIYTNLASKMRTDDMRIFLSGMKAILDEED